MENYHVLQSSWLIMLAVFTVSLSSALSQGHATNTSTDILEAGERTVGSVNSNKQSINGLKYLGTVEGKSFFADAGVGRNWYDAKAFCISSNMQMAQITSRAQLDLLYSARQQGVFYKWHWIGGRDSLQISMFVWDNGNQIVQNHGSGFRHYTGVQNCLTYSPSVELRGRIEANDCSIKMDVVCEVASGQ